MAPLRRAERRRSPGNELDVSRRSRQSHEAILRATVEILAEDGYRALTIDGVAGRAGVGKATIYRWWPSKGVLALEAIMDRVPPPSTEETGDLRHDLLAAISAMIDSLQHATTELALPELAADLAHDPDTSALFHQFISSRRAAVVGMLERAAERGELPADLDTGLFIDIYTGTISHRLFLSGEPVTGTLAGQLVDLLIDGRLPTISPDQGT